MRRTPGTAAALACLLGVAGCGGGSDRSSTAAGARPSASAAIRALVREARPIGGGARFRPLAPSRTPGRCRPRLGARFPVHLELFAADRVVLVPAGLGIGPPRHNRGGRVVAGRCAGTLVTLDPTGVVWARRGAPATLGTLFAEWGRPLSAHALLGFRTPADATVRVYVDGRRRPGPARAVALTPRAEIVLEVGPQVPPHARYAFPPRPPVRLGPERTAAG
jgi:hypothetical protein